MAGVFDLSNPYGQTQNRDGTWNGVMQNNLVPIDVEGYVKKPKVTRKSSGKPTPINYHGTNQPPVKDPGWPKEQQQQVDTQGGIKDGVTGAASKTAAAAIEEGNTNWANYQKAIAAAEFVIDVINANNSYQQTKGQAQLNILQARNDEADALYRGRQAQLQRESEGYEAGQDSLLAMAAQGQDVSGTAANKLSGSYEAMGYQMGAMEMVNAYREALGYRLEEINNDWMVEQAAIARDNAYFGSALKLGTTLAVL